MKTQVYDILVVEDSEDVAEVLKDLLVTQGYSCRVVADGEAVFPEIAGKKPDLILLDIRLPGIDGFTVCRRLKSRDDTAGIPVMFISALRSEDDVMEARNSGGVYYISKPFDIGFLLEKVASILESGASPAPAPVPAPPVQDRGRILMVEPEYRFHDEGIGDALKSAGYEVYRIHDARETIRSARRIAPLAILLDLDDALLPFERVADALVRNAETRFIPVLWLTRIPQDPETWKKIVPSLEGVLQKPADRHAVLQTVNRLCDRAATQGKTGLLRSADSRAAASRV